MTEPPPGPAGSTRSANLPRLPHPSRPPYLPLTPGAGIVAAVDLVRSRPARLGRIRLVAVDGPSGSGKSTLAGPLATAIAAALGGVVIRPRRSRNRKTDRSAAAAQVASRDPSPAVPGEPSSAVPDEPSSAVPGEPSSAVPGPLVTVVSTDLLATWERPLEWWPLLEQHLLAPLAAGGHADLPVVQWVSGNPRPGGAIRVPPVDVLVLEGVSSGRRAVADRLSVLIWVEVPDPAVRLERAVARDGEAMRRFLSRWQRDEQAHFRADGTRGRADIAISP